jgi:glycine/D-amino acid oxidase-like deaminating enzyme
MDGSSRAIVVGAGMAGMSCALRLAEAGIDYLLIGDGLGGRIRYSETEKVNFGAYFVMANYGHAKRLLPLDGWINPLSCTFHDGAGHGWSTIGLHTLRRLPGFAKFAFQSIRFMRHYGPYKRNCLKMSQREALAHNPFIGRLFTQRASEWVAQHGLDAVVTDYIGKFSYACTGAQLDSLTALDFLNVTQGLLLPIHRFRFDEAAMEKRLGGHFLRDRVTALNSEGGRHMVTCASGATYETDRLVLATPAVETQRLLELPAIRKSCRLYVHHVRATLRSDCTKHSLNLFPFESPLILTAVQPDGTYLVYAREPDTDLGLVCETFEPITTVAWENAMYVDGNPFMEQQHGPGLYVAGDHNGLGLEPAAISGIYAANQVIGRSSAVRPV